MDKIVLRARMKELLEHGYVSETSYNNVLQRMEGAPIGSILLKKLPEGALEYTQKKTFDMNNKGATSVLREEVKTLQVGEQLFIPLTKITSVNQLRVRVSNISGELNIKCSVVQDKDGDTPGYAVRRVQ